MLDAIKGLINQKKDFVESASLILEDTGITIDDSIVLGLDESVEDDSSSENLDLLYEDSDSDFGDVSDNDSGDTEPIGEEGPEEAPEEDEDDDVENDDVKDLPVDNDEDSVPTPVGNQTGEPAKVPDTELLNTEIDIQSNTPSDILPVPPAGASSAIEDDVLDSAVDSGFDKPITPVENPSDDLLDAPVDSEETDGVPEKTPSEETEDVEEDLGGDDSMGESYSIADMIFDSLYMPIEEAYYAEEALSKKERKKEIRDTFDNAIKAYDKKGDKVYKATVDVGNKWNKKHNNALGDFEKNDEAIKSLKMARELYGDKDIYKIVRKMFGDVGSIYVKAIYKKYCIDVKRKHVEPIDERVFFNVINRILTGDKKVISSYKKILKTMLKNDALDDTLNVNLRDKIRNTEDKNEKEKLRTKYDQRLDDFHNKNKNEFMIMLKKALIPIFKKETPKLSDNEISYHIDSLVRVLTEYFKSKSGQKLLETIHKKSEIKEKEFDVKYPDYENKINKKAKKMMPKEDSNAVNESSEFIDDFLSEEIEESVESEYIDSLDEYNEATRLSKEIKRRNNFLNDISEIEDVMFSLEKQCKNDYEKNFINKMLDHFTNEYHVLMHSIDRKPNRKGITDYKDSLGKGHDAAHAKRLLDEYPDKDFFGKNFKEKIEEGQKRSKKLKDEYYDNSETKEKKPGKYLDMQKQKTEMKQKLTESEDFDYDDLIDLCVDQYVESAFDESTDTDELLDTILEAISLDGDSSSDNKDEKKDEKKEEAPDNNDNNSGDTSEAPAEDNSSDSSSDEGDGTIVEDDNSEQNEITDAIQDKVSDTEDDLSGTQAGSDPKDTLLRKLSNITKNLEDAKKAVMDSM